MADQPPAWQRPPFEPGNDLAVTHGVYSSKRVEPVALELVAGAVALHPDLAAPRYVFAVRAWARAEARVALLEDWLIDHALVDGEGEPLGVLKLMARLERLAADLRARLGLDPRSHAELDRQRTEANLSAVDLDAVRAAGREVIDADSEEPPLALAPTDETTPEEGS